MLLYRQVRQQKVPKTKRRFWVHQILQARGIYGAYHHLVPDLEKDPVKFKEYFRMSKEEFYFVLERVAPLISREDTFMRKALSARERLAITIR